MPGTCDTKRLVANVAGEDLLLATSAGGMETAAVGNAGRFSSSTSAAVEEGADELLDGFDPAANAVEPLVLEVLPSLILSRLASRS